MLIFLFSAFTGKGGLNNPKERPNIILIMIDDLGYGDLACYVSQVNNTPNMDRLASEGMLFTDFHSNGAMCSPTRAALMTGRCQYRFGKIFEHALSSVDNPNEGLSHEARTIAEVLKEAGYTNGIYGKWHLGYKPPFLPPSHGFDDFRGLVSGDGDHHTHIDRLGNEDWWHNDRLDMETGYSTDLTTDHSIRFIEKHQKEPFFLFVSHLAVHFPWQGPGDPSHREAGTDYRNDKWGIIPDPDDVRPHLKSMLAPIDDGVGEIMEKVRELELENRTLLLFTSDNGGYINYGSLFRQISSNGPLRGQKQQIYEGGHRVPLIAWWPGRIQAGSISDELAMTMDLFPTLACLAGADPGSNHPLDGIDISNVFFGNSTTTDRTLYWKIGDHIKAVRKGPWKICVSGNAEPELYNLDQDIGETRNLAREYPDLVRSLMTAYYRWEKKVTANYYQR